jgi:hypothetical protein
MDAEADQVIDVVQNDRNSEMAVLAACLISRTARDEARRHLSGSDFFQPQHEVVWDAMARLDRHGKPVDPSTILSVIASDPSGAAKLLPDLITWPVVADNVGEYASPVRSWAIKRRLYAEAVKVQQQALNPEASAQGFAASVATRFASLRDTGVTDDIASITMDELLAEVDDEPAWLIPGLLERRDRLMLTGEEGLGKSYLLRQIAVMAAAGLDPFDPNTLIPPIRVMIIDCENTQRQIRRKVRGVVEFAERWSYGKPGVVTLLCSNRMDITRDKDLARIHYELDATQPDLLVIGPLYRLVPRALQTDDEAAPVLAALDTIRERDIALLIEAHAGHSLKGAHRDLRPRGSSSLLGWPEFGYGMRTVASGYADLVPWRGDRDERAWPQRVRHCNDRLRWIPVENEWTPTGAIA